VFLYLNRGEVSWSALAFASSRKSAPCRISLPERIDITGQRNMARGRLRRQTPAGQRGFLSARYGMVTVSEQLAKTYSE